MIDIRPKDTITFASIFSRLIENRNVPSDEWLARRAAAQQDAKKPRVNVQPRTINNWRNGRSEPRRLDDRQLVLVLKALNITEKDQAVLADYFRTRNQKRISTTPAPKTGIPKIYQYAAVLAAAAVCLFLVLMFRPAETPAAGPAYVAEIPPTSLRLSQDGFVLPASARSVISIADLQSLTDWELFVARNEIYARKGRPFVKDSSGCLQAHFNAWSVSSASQNGWYVKRSGEPQLSDLEYRNAEIIRNYECKIRGGQRNCTGQTLPCN